MNVVTIHGQWVTCVSNRTSAGDDSPATAEPLVCRASKTVPKPILAPDRNLARRGEKVLVGVAWPGGKWRKESFGERYGNMAQDCGTAQLADDTTLMATAPNRAGIAAGSIPVGQG